MYLQPLGAIRTVTGSMHLIEINGKKILMDCGLYQGHREDAYRKNKHIPIPVKEVDMIILSHAHLDHSGNIPTLVNQGYSNPIYSTFATRDLCSAMLQDSAGIQEKDIERVNRKKLRQGVELFKPLYRMEDAVNAMKLFRGIGFDTPQEISPGVELTYRKAGHILGAAMVELNLSENGKKTKLVYTGDLGRKNIPILPDPYQFNNPDIFLSESTYGDRLHDPADHVDSQLEALIKEATVKKSKIIIPAFAVDRTQQFVYQLHKLCDSGRCYNIPIFVDSPLALNVTQTYRLHPECFDEEALKFIHEEGDPFGFERLKYIRSTQESIALNDQQGPMIIISASGMCEGGRILHHLKNNIANPNNIILIIGYAAEGTLAKKIVDREPEVLIFGEPYPLKAKVVVMNSFSGHADKNELIEYYNGFTQKPRQVILVHGDEDQSLAFQNTLLGLGFPKVAVPKMNDRFEL